MSRWCHDETAEDRKKHPKTKHFLLPWDCLSFLQLKRLKTSDANDWAPSTDHSSTQFKLILMCPDVWCKPNTDLPAWYLNLSSFNPKQSATSSAPTLVIGVAGEAELGDHQIGEAEWHGAVDLCQSVQAVGPLEKVFGAMPHSLVSTAGILFQVAEVHGFDKDPRGLIEPGRLGVFP